MLEVLITIVILAFGLLGLAGLQARTQVAEIEAYQRAQAVVLLQDMVDRVKANGKNLDYKDIDITVGTDNTTVPASCGGLTGKNLDECDWHHALLGATETSGGNNFGAMIDARGCVTNTVNTMPREFLVSVVWQGLAPTTTPTSTTCGQNLYGNGNDATRRALVARIKIGCLQNDTGGTCVTP
jgi:type IV pilus assembly protein PilV